MKIIITTPLYPPEIENLAVYSQGLAENLKNSHQVTVLAYAGKTEKVSGFSLVIIDKYQRLVVRLFKYTWRLFQLSKQADLIYAQNAVAAGLPAAIVRKFFKIPLVINFFEDEAWKRALHLQLTDKSLVDFLVNPNGDRKTMQLIKIQQWSLRQADKILVPNEFLAKVVSGYYKISLDKILVNPQPEARQEILPFPNEIVPQQIYFNTQLYKWNKVEQLIEAVLLLQTNWSEVKLFIVGDGSAKENLKQLVERLNLRERIIFLGKVSSAQEQYLSQTSKVVIQSLENFSTPELVEQISTAFVRGTKNSASFSWEQHLTHLENIFKSIKK